MQSTIQFKSHFLPFKSTHFSNPFVESTHSTQSLKFSSKSLIFTPSNRFSLKTQIQKPIICARKSKKTSESERSSRLMLELVSVLASNVDILPQPLGLVVRNLVGGEGRELKIFSSLSEVGFFNGGRRRRRRNVKKILGLVAFLGYCLLCFFLRKELRSEIYYPLGVLGFGIFVAAFALIKEWRKGIEHLIFGFCCFGVLIGLGLRGDGAMKKIYSFSSSMVEVGFGRRAKSRGKRRGRWAF